MRLIDADTLYAKAAKREKEAMEALLKCDANKDHELWLKLNEVLIERALFKSDVADAPTMEERKTGKWEYSTSSCGPVAFIHRKCSECGYENMGMGSKYCPDCGARMVNVDD